MFLMQRRQTQPIKLIQCFSIVTCRIKLSWGYSLTLVYLDVCFLGKPAHVTVVGLANSTCTQYMIVRLVMKCVVDYNIHVHVWYMHPGFSCTSLMIPIIKHFAYLWLSMKPVLFVRTQDSIMMSLSPPWKASTVDTSTDFVSF